MPHFSSRISNAFFPPFYHFLSENEFGVPRYSCYRQHGYRSQCVVVNRTGSRESGKHPVSLAGLLLQSTLRLYDLLVF